MIKAFWTWNPVCSGEFRRFDEPFMLRHNDWLFDREVWRDTLRAMAERGFNAMVFANTHPFPFMVRCGRFPQSALLDDARLERYREAYRWIFREAKSFGIRVWLLFFSVYYPEPMLESMGVYDRDAYDAGDLAIDYTRCCVEETLKDYPDLDGLFGDASENISGSRSRFLREALVEPFERLAAGKDLLIRGWWSDIDEFRTQLRDQARVPITFSVKYTWEHFVSADPDPLFTRWVDAMGAGRVAAEFWISNFEPFTSFSRSTAAGAVESLRCASCAGFSIHPLSIYEWPFTSDRCWRYQFERDAAWFKAWGDAGCLSEEHAALLEDDRLACGFEAASEILKSVAVYFAGDRQNQWRPQMCSVRHSDGIRLLSLEDMCNLRGQASPWGVGIWRAFDSLDWRTTFTGVPTMHFEDYDPADTTAYGPRQFVEEMQSLAQVALAAAGSAERRGLSARQQCLVKHAVAQALLGQFWAERAEAGLAHVSGDRSAAVRHMETALEHFRSVEMLEASHRGSFRLLTGRCAQTNGWDMPREALERELADYRVGISGRVYPAGRTEHRDTSAHPRGRFELPR